MLDGKDNNDVDNEKQGDSSRKQEGKTFILYILNVACPWVSIFDFVNVIHFKLENCVCNSPWQANAY